MKPENYFDFSCGDKRRKLASKRSRPAAANRLAQQLQPGQAIEISKKSVFTDHGIKYNIRILVFSILINSSNIIILSSQY